MEALPAQRSTKPRDLEEWQRHGFGDRPPPTPENESTWLTLGLVRRLAPPRHTGRLRTKPGRRRLGVPTNSRLKTMALRWARNLATSEVGEAMQVCRTRRHKHVEAQPSVSSPNPTCETPSSSGITP